jgi:hypothetical protein
MPRLIRPLDQNALRSGIDDLLELLDLHLRGAETGQMRRR